MRIIAGKHRGRRLYVPRGTKVRPSAERVREAVFNILSHHADVADLEGAIAVDIFAGTGAYGWEALSRGAAQSVFVDRSPGALTGIHGIAIALNEDKRVVLLKLDATRLPAPPGNTRVPADLVFLDPPYGSGMAVPALEGLRSRCWIGGGAVCIVEVAALEAFIPPLGFTPFDERSYGASRVTFLRCD